MTIIYATKANLKKYYPKYGNRLRMFSPYTGEEYSANPSDYFWAPPDHRFKDSKRRVMQLGTHVSATVSPLRGITAPTKRKAKSKRRR